VKEERKYFEEDSFAGQSVCLEVEKKIVCFRPGTGQPLERGSREDERWDVDADSWFNFTE
jgi:hypothetical protein